MNNNELLEIIKQNNDLLKKINEKLSRMEKTGNKMDSHIDNVMGIYQGYKAPLDYITSYFTSKTIDNTENKKPIENKKKL